jgi:MFS family permease
MSSTSSAEGDLYARSTGELLGRLARETSVLVRQELDLAKAEMTEKGRRAGRGAGMFGAAGVVGLLALGALTACLIALLATALDHVWLAALVVAVVFGVVAGVLALMGKREVQESTPPLPEQTIDTVKEDVQWARTQRPSARR